MTDTPNNEPVWTVTVAEEPSDAAIESLAKLLLSVEENSGPR